MSHSTKTKQKDLLSTQLNAEETNNSEYSIKHDIVPNTPFAITTDEKGSFLRMGMYRLTEYKSIDEIHDYIKNNQWDLVVNIVSAILDFEKNFEKLAKSNPE